MTEYACEHKSLCPGKGRREIGAPAAGESLSLLSLSVSGLCKLAAAASRKIHFLPLTVIYIILLFYLLFSFLIFIDFHSKSAYSRPVCGENLSLHFHITL